MSLGVFWDRREVGRLERVDERSREYAFEYTEHPRRISVSLPIARGGFTPAESRSFFEALLPEGAVREQIAAQLKLASSDSYGLLTQLGRDCAGALEIVEGRRMSGTPDVEWLSRSKLEDLVVELPRRPLGIMPGETRIRLSLAGVQRKAILVERDGSYGLPLEGMASTHILKPEADDEAYPGLATNEYFCMRLGAALGLRTAHVQLATVAERRCLIVKRYDRDLARWPPARLHQEDLCQALGLTPDFKYQLEAELLPSYRALARLLDEHSPDPGLDRLEAANSVVFHFLLGNADAHAKNISLLYGADGVRLAPLYDVVSTAVYPELTSRLALSIGDEFDPAAVTSIHWRDLSGDFGLNPSQFDSVRSDLARRVLAESELLRESAFAEGWHHPCIDQIIATATSRAAKV